MGMSRVMRKMMKSSTTPATYRPPGTEASTMASLDGAALFPRPPPPRWPSGRRRRHRCRKVLKQVAQKLCRARVVREDVLIGELGIGDAYVLRTLSAILALDLAAGEGAAGPGRPHRRGRGHQRGPVSETTIATTPAMPRMKPFCSRTRCTVIIMARRTRFITVLIFLPPLRTYRYSLYTSAPPASQTTRFSEAQDWALSENSPGAQFGSVLPDLELPRRRRSRTTVFSVPTPQTASPPRTARSQSGAGDSSPELGPVRRGDAAQLGSLAARQRTRALPVRRKLQRHRA